MVAEKVYTPEQSIWKEQRNLFPTDLVFRSRGFRIVSRPQRGPVLWKKRIDGKWQRFTQEQAEDME